MMQRNVFFKARLLIPLCLWCVRFRHNNHLVRKKNTFWLKIPNCYGLPVKNIQFLTPWARPETVLSALANVELQTLYLSHHPLRLLIQTGLFFFNISTSNSGFLCMQIEKCAEIQVDGNVPIQTVPWTEQLRSGWITQSCHYFALTVWNESRFLNLQPKRESFLLPTCCLLVRDTLSEFWDI